MRLHDFPGLQSNQQKELIIHCRELDSRAHLGALGYNEGLRRIWMDQENIRRGRGKTEEWFLQAVGILISLSLLYVPITVCALFSQRKYQIACLCLPQTDIPDSVWFISGSQEPDNAWSLEGAPSCLLKKCIYVKGISSERGKERASRFRQHAKTSLSHLFLQHSLSKLFPS